MKKIAILTCLFFITRVAFSQTNNPAPYCAAISFMGCCQPGGPNAPGNFVNHFIHCFVTTGANANINNLNSGCNGANGYVNFCNHYMATMPGQVVTCSVQLSTIY